jgi:hypothetical protein
LHKEPSNNSEVTPSSKVKEGGIKVEIKEKYLPNYGRYSEKLAEVKSPCAKCCSKTVLQID